jgi:DhnA family fructose-bisphosphate aldolase class Ia
MTASSRHTVKGYRFDLEGFFPRALFEAITDVRLRRPEVVAAEAARRKRRDVLAPDSKLTILAADHPARRLTNVGSDPVAMGDRYQYLGRILRVIASDEFDGVMATTDVIEELFIVSHLVREAGSPPFLDGKVMLGCMNRGGLAGTVFEMDDRFTSFTPDSIAALRLDAAKMMFRLADNDPGSLDTIASCAEAISKLNALGISTFLEPLAVQKTEGRWKTLKEPTALIKVIGVASALGGSSLRLWLKIPYCHDFEQVARATTLPILMLGGEAAGDPTGILEEFAAGMRAGSNVRGALVGRNVLFPGDDDPLATAMAVQRIVHEGLDAGQAVGHLMASRSRDMDRLSRWVPC